MTKRFVNILLTFSLLFFPYSKKDAHEKTKDDPDKVTREANGTFTWYKDWVYYWGRNQAEQGTQVTNAFYREKLDGSEKVMLSDWNEQVYSGQFDIENNSIYYLGYEDQNGKWRYFLKKMDLDGRNKETVLDSVSFGGFEVEGNWFYQIGYDATSCPNSREDYRPGVLYRTNLKTKNTVVLKKCIYPRLGMITKKGMYLKDEFFPITSNAPEKSHLKRIGKLIEQKSPEDIEINQDSVFPDRGMVYYMIWDRQALRPYFFSYNEETKEVRLVKEFPSPYQGPYFRMVNVHRGFAYFEVSSFANHTRYLYRMPLKGGKLKKVIKIPDRTSYSLINNHVFLLRENLKVLSRIPITEKRQN